MGECNSKEWIALLNKKRVLERAGIKINKLTYN
jgi:hypothetical protein